MANALQAFNALSHITDTRLDYLTSLNIKAGQEKCKAFELEFSNALNEKMLNFSQRTDYNNFDGELDSLYNEWRDKGNADSYGNYAANIINGYLDQSYSQSSYSVKGMQIKAMQNDINLNAERTVNGIIISDMDMGTACESIRQTRDGQLANGSITPEQYKINIATDYSTMLKSRAYKAAQAVISSGGTLSEALASMDSYFNADIGYAVTDTKSFSVEPGADGTLHVKEGSARESIKDLVDTNSIKSDLTNQVKTLWNTEVKAMQESNAGKLSEIYCNIVTSDMAKWPDVIDDFGNAINSLNGNRLSEEDRLKYTKLYDALKDDIARNGDKTTASGNNQVKVDGARAVMKENMHLFVNALNMGNFGDIDEAREAFVYKGYEEYVTSMKNAGYDISNYTYNDFMTETLDVVESFVTECQKSGYIPSEVADNMNKGTATLNYIGELAGLKPDKNGNYSEAEVKNLLKSKGIDFENEMARLSNVYFDIVVETDFKDTNAVETVNNKLKNLIGSILIARIDNRNVYEIERKAGQNEKRSIAKVVYALEQDEAATTLNDSALIYGGKRQSLYAYGLEEQKEENSKIFSAEIKKVAGDALNLVGKEQESVRDVNPNPVFVDTNTGDEYKLYSADGETYSVMKKTRSSEWETLTTKDGANIKKEEVVGGNSIQYQVQQAMNKQNKEAETKQESDFAKRYAENVSTSKLLDELESTKTIPYFYDSFWKIGKPKSEAEFKEWWSKAPENKKQQYLEYLRKNYPGRYASMVKNTSSYIIDTANK